MKAYSKLSVKTACMLLAAIGAVSVGCKKKNPADPTSKSTSTRTPTSSPGTPTNTRTFTHTYTSTLTGTPTPTPDPAGPAVVNLGTAGNFVLLSKAGISTAGTTSIVGDIGVSPIDSTAITGFSLVMDASNTFSTSTLVSGSVYAPDYTPPTPAMISTAIFDLEAAFVDAAGRANPAATELGAGDISGLTLNPGLYKWGTGLLINTGVTLDCLANVNAVFIFQVAQNLDVGNAAIVALNGGCQAKNIFWQVSGQVALGPTSDFKGIILCQTLIDMQSGATFDGMALAQTEITLNSNTITQAN